MLSQAHAEATVPTTRLDRAREFYEGTLGLAAAGPEGPGPALLYECGGDTRLFVYERPPTGVPSHTLAHFRVDDVEAEVAELRGRGVTFEEYDMPDLKTVDGVATVDDFKAAWFKDPDGNIIGIHD